MIISLNLIFIFHGDQMITTIHFSLKNASFMIMISKMALLWSVPGYLGTSTGPSWEWSAVMWITVGAHSEVLGVCLEPPVSLSQSTTCCLFSSWCPFDLAVD